MGGIIHSHCISSPFFKNKILQLFQNTVKSIQFFFKMNLDENHKIDLDKYDIIKLMGQNLNYANNLLIQCKTDSKLYSLEIKRRTSINTTAFNFLIQFKHPTFVNLIGYICQSFQFEGKEYNNIPNEIGLLYEFC